MATTTEARPWPLTLDRWHAMLAAGILAEDDRVELIEGMLVEMPPPLPQHQSPIDVLTRHFARAAPDAWFVRVQGPLTFPGLVSEPQPDLALIAADAPRPAHPATALLVVEVAVTSLAYDRGPKARLYARAGIPELWIVDVPGRRVEVRTRPQDGEFRELRTFGEGEQVVPGAVACPPVPVAALFA
jgi:Uma2 family endonuclease